jgi:hypothetical protein
MNKVDFQSMTVTQLVGRFSELALEQDHAQLFGKIKLYNRIYDDLVAVKNELAARPGDQRSALMSLYSHPNAQVRLKAAQWSLAVARAPAQQVLQEISSVTSIRKPPTPGNRWRRWIGGIRSCFKHFNPTSLESLSLRP